MKISLRPSRRKSRRAFTLVEIMTATGLFALVVIGIVYTQLFGLRLFNVTSAKVGASDNARKVLNVIRNDIRSSKLLYIGNGNGGTFTNIAGTGLRQGTALEIYPTTATNVYVRYFLDPASQSLQRATSAGGTPEVLAPYLTNQIAFDAEDFHGNILTNDQNNRVIKVMMDFYQWEFPTAQAGGGAYYNYYHLQTRVTRRAID